VAKRVHLPRVHPEMQRWSAVLEAELASWPRVTSRPMFGLVGYYRERRIFAAIPRTRAANTPFSLLIKLPDAKHPRVVRGGGPGAAWVTFAMDSESDLAEALRLLGHAYEKARARPAAARHRTDR
jgi:hypothetical protein